MICLSVLRFPPVMIFIITVMAAGPEFGAKGRIDRLVWYGFDLVGQKTYSSESGVYTVEVDSRDPMWVGRYSAAYRFSADGKRVWSEERPYTLREVVVTNTGMVVGFAYRSELEATGERNDPRDYFHIVIIDRHGREILNDVTERLPLRYSCTPPVPRRPYAEQLIVDSDNDRIVVRVVEHDGDACVWWIYRLSTGHLLQRFNLKILLDSLHAAWVLHAQPVLGTPLMVVHCGVLDKSVAFGPYGALFTLIDLDGKPVWTLGLPNDYTALYNAEADRDLTWYLMKHPAILRSHSPKRFEIRSFAKNQRIEFGVNQDATGSWVVSEVSRTVYKDPGD